MKCVKSVLGEFSSGVSVCRNKGTQSDLGVPFLPGSPPAGVYGGPFLRLCLQANALFVSKIIALLRAFVLKQLPQAYCFNATKL